MEELRRASKGRRMGGTRKRDGAPRCLHPGWLRGSRGIRKIVQYQSPVRTYRSTSASVLLLEPCHRSLSDHPTLRRHSLRPPQMHSWQTSSRVVHLGKFPVPLPLSCPPLSVRHEVICKPHTSSCPAHWRTAGGTRAAGFAHLYLHRRRKPAPGGFTQGDG